jgi:hypothetical protein
MVLKMRIRCITISYRGKWLRLLGGHKFFQLDVLRVAWQLYQPSTDELQEPWELIIKRRLTVHWHISLWSREQVFSDFLKWLITYFRLHLQLPNGKRLSLQQQQGPMSVAFHYDCSTVCVTAIRAAQWKETLRRIYQQACNEEVISKRFK